MGIAEAMQTRTAAAKELVRTPIVLITYFQDRFEKEAAALASVVDGFHGKEGRLPMDYLRVVKQKLDAVYPMSAAARALLGELLLRGPQTLAGLRANSERMHAMPAVAEFDALFAELKDRPAGALVRQLPRQPGQKEARWTQLLTGEPSLSELRRDSSSGSATGEEPLKVALTLPPEAERRIAALEAEGVHLRAELARLRTALGV